MPFVCPSTWKASSSWCNILVCPELVLFVTQMWKSIIKGERSSMTLLIKTFSCSAGYKSIDVPEFCERLL